MSQIVNIFRKDCRRFWPEVLVSVLMVSAFVWSYPFQWLDYSSSAEPGAVPFLDVNRLHILSTVIVLLMIVSWLILISRVVHAENLIGTRQFWVTRPYEWQKLVSAKVLFIAVFIFAPFVLAQMTMLARAGFQPLAYLPGLLFSLLLLIIVCVVPLFAFSAVVSSILRMIYVLMGVAAVGAIFAFFAGSSHSNHPHLALADRMSAMVVLSFCGSALAVAYASRRIWLARALLITGAIMLGLSAYYAEILLFGQVYRPLPSVERVPFRGVDPANHRLEVTRELSGKGFEIQIPINTDASLDGRIFQIDNVAATLKTASGESLISPWDAVTNKALSSREPAVQVPVYFPGTVTNALRSQPVHYQVELAVTELSAQTPLVFAGSDNGKLTIPNFGICNASSLKGQSGLALDCRLPLRKPDPTEISYQLRTHPCSDSLAAEPSPPLIARGWEGELDEDPADVGLNSVWRATIYFRFPEMPDWSRAFLHKL